MAEISFLTKNRICISRELDEREAYWRWTPALLSWRHAASVYLEKLKGRVLEAGAGEGNIRALLKGHVTEYVSLDKKHGDGIDLVADIQEMPQVSSASFDSIVCINVFEYLDRPQAALSEFSRVMKSGATLFLSVPFLSPIHDSPHDYLRYTPDGISRLCKNAGFNEIKVSVSGGLFTFLAHPVCFVLVLGTWRIPFLRWFVFEVVSFLIVRPAVWLDGFGIFKSRFPVNVLVSATKV